MRIIPTLTAALTALLSAPVSGQDSGRVGGRIVDAATGASVEGVVVRLAELQPVISDDRGLFDFPDVPPGEWPMAFEHVAYGSHQQTVEVIAGEETVLFIEISVEAIQLEPVVVETLSELERRRVTSGYSINELGPAEIAMAARAGLSLGELIRGSLPGVDVMGEGASICVTYRAIRTDNDRGDCDGVSVVLDGVPVADPSSLYTSLPLQDIQRVEVLSPSQAGVRYGMRTGQGALLVETKRGPVSRQEDLSRYLTGFGWTEEEPYPWLKVFGSALLVNAVTLGISSLMVDRCFNTQDASLALRTSCGPLGTAGSGILSVALPALGNGFAVRWAGSTDASRGRVVPAMVAAGLVLSAGYILVLGGEGATETTGIAVLSIGVPAVTTLVDRIIRIRR